ncbi:Yip1 family protein [Pontibacillus salicampi]|uniref:Yip1 family protein n=1 Tax=Pontibacillus salicampi TaxID=1449801 RepID=A0ABV6LQ34_9BACI
METNVETNVQNSGKPSLFGMVLNPGEQFEKVKSNPKVWVPLMFVTLLFTIGMSLMAMSLDAETIQGQQAGAVPAEQEEMLMMIAKVTMAITGIFIAPFTALIYTVIYLIVAKIAGSPAGFKKLFSMITYTLVISGFGLILNSLLMMAFGGNEMVHYTSLAGLLGQGSGIMNGIEIFAIWQTILTAIGLQKVGEMSKGLSWTAAILLFIATVFIGALSGAAGTM